jgi:predicted O-methyltransferase YrrM
MAGKRLYSKNKIKMKNLIINFISKKYFFSIIKKIIKRFEKDTSIEATQWAKIHVKHSTEEFCKSIDLLLYDEVKSDIDLIEKEARQKLSKLNISLGGGGNFILLYFFIRKFKLVNIVETGVAAGWSSLAILKALEKNGNGHLYSSDFPYFRLENPEKYIGYLAKDEKTKNNWFLDIRGDDKALPEIIKQIDNKNIDLFHYDSDKSYSGRSNALKLIGSKLGSKTIIIFDDIQNNLHFKDYIEKNKLNFHVIEFGGKFVGITGLDHYI